MHITVEPRDGFAILHLRGEFDTYYVPALQAEINALVQAGLKRLVLNLRLVRFINSTAMGAIIKASKQLGSSEGKLAISRPSKFCRDNFEKIGLDRVVPIFEDDEGAASAVMSGAPDQLSDQGESFEEDQSSVLFSPLDRERVEHFISEAQRSGDKPVNPVHGHSFGKNWSGIGRMAHLDGSGLAFTWSGKRTDLKPFEMGQLLALGTDWKVKFRLPLLIKGYCEAIATVSEVEERPEGVKVVLSFKDIDDETAASVRQYAADMAYLKEELKKATN